MSDDDIGGRAVGRSFRGRALQGADFSGKDVRGADFSGADLRGASFRDATFGVAPRHGAVFLGAAILASIAAGIAIGFAVERIRHRLSADQWDEVAEGGTVGLTLVVLVALIIWRGFDVAIKVVTVLYLAVLALNIVANFVWDDVEWMVVLRATVLVVFVVLAVTAGVLGRVIGGVFGAWSIALVAVLGGLASGRADGGGAGILVALSLVVISKRALRGDPRDRTLRWIVHRVVGRWGTRFVDADLAGADFTGADTGQCGVAGAKLDGVTWDPDQPLPVDIADDAVSKGR